MPDPRPLVALTMGDVAGIGPEVIVGAWTETVVHDWCRPVVVGHPEIVRRAVSLWRITLHVQEIAAPEEAQPSHNTIPCLRCGSDEVLQVEPGAVDARSGQAAFDAMTTAARLALDGPVEAVTTAPMSKEALHLAGHSFPDHVELLSKTCNVEDVATMLYLGPGEQVGAPAGLAVVHVTLHTPLAEVPGRIRTETILHKAQLADRFMRQVKGARPRIGVCGLNPHAGESGLFGSEEREIIGPAVQRGCEEGLQLVGPLPVDALMLQAADGEFDAVVAMYHDQGHIAMKLLGRRQAITVTFGLPFIHSSVAHGTAFDIAWKRRAETAGMVEAIHVASLLAAGKRPV